MSRHLAKGTRYNISKIRGGIPIYIESGHFLFCSLHLFVRLVSHNASVFFSYRPVIRLSVGRGSFEGGTQYFSSACPLIHAVSYSISTPDNMFLRVKGPEREADNLHPRSDRIWNL